MGPSRTSNPYPTPPNDQGFVNEPVFRVLKIASAPFVLSVTVEHGGVKRGTSVREQFGFGRDRLGRLALHERTTLT